MTDRKFSHTREEWETIDAVPLPPGWFNVYEANGKKFWTPCPALLRQEHRSTWRCYTDASSTETRHTPPYDVRIVAADFDGATLEPIDDVGNYVGTVHETELDGLA